LIQPPDKRAADKSAAAGDNDHWCFTSFLR
jgi:hypothetical protein